MSTLTQMIENYHRENIGTHQDCAEAIGRHQTQVERAYKDLLREVHGLFTIRTDEGGAIFFDPVPDWIRKWASCFYSHHARRWVGLPPISAIPELNENRILHPAEERIQECVRRVAAGFSQPLDLRFVNRTLGELRRDRWRRGQINRPSWYGWSGRNGVYYHLRADGTLLYIGRSEIGLCGRTGQHINERLRPETDDLIVGLIVSTECWRTDWVDPIECHMIRSLHPRDNDRHNR